MTLLFPAALGDGKGRGLNRLARDGLIKRSGGGRCGLAPQLGAAAASSAIIAPGIDMERDILAQTDLAPIIDNPKLMDARMFQPGLMSA